MKRPLLIVAISYLIGIIIGVYLKNSIPFIMFVSIVVVSAILINKPRNKTLKQKDLNKIIKHSKCEKLSEKIENNKKTEEKLKLLKYLKITAIIVFVILISSVKTTYLNNKYNTLYSTLKEDKITLVGTICSNIEETDYKYTITIKVQNVNKNNKYNNTNLILNIKKKQIKNITKLQYGNKIIVKGIYEEPTTQRNYKGFSYKEYLKTKEIYGIVEVENEEDITIIKQNSFDLINMQVNKLSVKFKENLEKFLSQETSGLAKGILLGDSSDIEDKIRENFKDCNLSHMLAVSGTHLSYLVLGLNLISNKNIVGKRNTKIISIIVIIIFIIITGMSPSVVRAGITTIIYIIATLIHRKPDTYTAISFSLLYTLIKNPFSIFNIGMQLSYAGTIGIILFYSVIENKFSNKKDLNSEVIEKNNTNIKEKTKNKDNKYNGKKLAELFILKIKNYIISSAVTSISANILILPLTIYNFNTISLNFILSNLVASPILGICIILGLFTIIISMFSTVLTKIFSVPLNLFLNILIKITELISQIPMGNIITITPYIITITAMYIIIFICYIWVKNKFTIEKIKNILKKRYIKILFILLIFITIITSIFEFINTRQELKIYFIDVGQGDSSLICTPSGKNILIDGGGSRDSEKYDVGEKILLPYLLDRRIKKLDYIIISHFDADHCQGLQSVIKNIKVKNVIISKQASQSELFEQIMELCQEKNINVIVVKRGGKITIDKYTYFEILHPVDKMLDDGKGGLNANAIVAKLHYKTTKNGDYTILFTGDIEEAAEKELVKLYGNKLKSDILKVAHHGSKTSSTYEFLQEVKPSISLIGVGEDNTFGHPNEGVLQRLESINTKVYRTDLNGEIEIKINKEKGIKVSTKINSELTNSTFYSII